MLNPEKPFNQLPLLLPPKIELETPAVMKQLVKKAGICCILTPACMIF